VLRVSPDHSLVGAMAKILILRGVRVQIHGASVQKFASCLFSEPADPTCGAPRKKEMETKYPGIQVHGKRNGARSPHVSFLETRNAQGGTFIVSWKRNTRKIRVCFLCFLFPVFRLRPYL